MADMELLAAERRAALREAFVPVGSIGPNRRRCLDKLRRYPVIAALISAEAQTVRHEVPGHIGRRSSARIRADAARVACRVSFTFDVVGR